MNNKKVLTVAMIIYLVLVFILVLCFLINKSGSDDNEQWYSENTKLSCSDAILIADKYIEGSYKDIFPYLCRWSARTLVDDTSVRYAICFGYDTETPVVCVSVDANTGIATLLSIDSLDEYHSEDYFKEDTMRKILLCLAILPIFLIVGCSEMPAANNKVSVVTTIWPVYDWVKTIAGDNVSLIYLLDSGVDLHNYQPSAEDLMDISKCDLFIYVGGESDEWVDDALKSVENPERTTLCLMDVLKANLKEEEVIPGMQGTEEHDEPDHNGPEYDEHIWLSLWNAQTAVDAISGALCAIDDKNKALYIQNSSDYMKKLSDLNDAYTQAVDSASHRTLLFGDRFPFRYLTSDYDLDYYAAFTGCSAETEASFETIMFLAKKIDELGLKTILTIEGSDQKIAEAIRDNTVSKDQDILTLNSMQSVIASDQSYLSIMQANLENLIVALK